MWDHLYHSEVIVESGWDSLGFWQDEKVLNVYLEEDTINPRENYDHIAQFQQLERGYTELDDISDLSGALCAAAFLDDCEYCSYHSDWRYRYGSTAAEEILNRHIRLWHPDILWHGQLSKNGYSQGEILSVYAIVTESDMVTAGFTAEEINSETAGRIANTEFEEYSAWVLGDCYWAEYDGEAIYGFIGSDFDKVLKYIKGSMI